MRTPVIYLRALEGSSALALCFRLSLHSSSCAHNYLYDSCHYCGVFFLLAHDYGIIGIATNGTWQGPETSETRGGAAGWRERLQRRPVHLAKILEEIASSAYPRSPGEATQRGHRVGCCE